MMRAFRVLSESELQQIRDRAQAAVVAWGTDWLKFGSGRPSDVRIEQSLRRPATLSDSSTVLLMGTSAAGVTLRYNGSFAAVLWKGALGSEPGREAPSAALAQLAARGLADLVSRLVPSGSGDHPTFRSLSPTEHANAFDRFSGSVCISLLEADATAEVWIPDLTVRQLLPDRSTRPSVPARFEARQSAVQHVPVRLNVELFDADFRLNDLSQIKPGSILRFDHKPSSPFIVTISGQQVARAFLGKGATDRLAVKLVRAK